MLSFHYREGACVLWTRMSLIWSKIKIILRFKEGQILPKIKIFNLINIPEDHNSLMLKAILLSVMKSSLL